MTYSPDEIIQYIEEEDIRFVKLAFCDVFGKQKNISINQSEIRRAFETGIAIDASSIYGFGSEVHSDVFLKPDPATLANLPWRPQHGRVVRMYCDVVKPDGTNIESDTRNLLKKAIEDAERHGLLFYFGAEMEFYLFKCDDNGNPTKIPYDEAEYMDVAPFDKGENIRREACLFLEEMGIETESSHHEDGPGQNEIDFRYSKPLKAADDAVTFKNVIHNVAARNGLTACFTPKPLTGKPGSGMHINFSVKSKSEDVLNYAISGVLNHIKEITVFLNPTTESYLRFGYDRAPKYISWSRENRSQLVRVPAASGEYVRAELRSPDPMCNPYLAYTLLIWACIDGIDNKMTFEEASDINFYNANSETLKNFETLPLSLSDAVKEMCKSEFVKQYIPKSIIQSFSN